MSNYNLKLPGLKITGASLLLVLGAFALWCGLAFGFVAFLAWAFTHFWAWYVPYFWAAAPMLDFWHSFATVVLLLLFVPKSNKTS